MLSRQLLKVLKPASLRQTRSLATVITPLQATGKATVKPVKDRATFTIRVRRSPPS